VKEPRAYREATANFFFENLSNSPFGSGLNGFGFAKKKIDRQVNLVNASASSASFGYGN
jgi:hypothetical protein